MLTFLSTYFRTRHTFVIIKNIGIWLNKVNFYIGIMRSGSEKEEALHSTD